MTPAQRISRGPTARFRTFQEGGCASPNCVWVNSRRAKCFSGIGQQETRSRRAMPANRSYRRLGQAGVALASVLLLAACSGSSPSASKGTSSNTGASNTTAASDQNSGSGSFKAPTSGYVVYWDQDEEEDYYESANGSQGQLVTPWDPNGQMCLLNDGTG